ncbi:hypothetical protein [Lacrimispora amygdalina]|uniref:hypothetical protein n=1 Tax=Lacrimispora amygdalina TaxID=253257 RepID=UPI000BE475E4|nr:hypothetical protein [Lacrimispora amygdalina]
MKERHLLDRKDLVQCLMNNYEVNWKFHDLLTAIDKIPLIQESIKWIPVSEQLPKDWILVWVTVKYPYGVHTEKAKWEGSFKHTNGRDFKYPVVAWKPYYCPKPYTENRGIYS